MGKKENTEILNLRQMKQERIIYFQSETNMQHNFCSKNLLAMKMKTKNLKKHRYSWILNIQS